MAGEPYTDILTNDGPVDLRIKAEAIRRRRAIAEALQKNSLETPQGTQVGDRYVPVQPLAAFAKVFQGWLGGHNQREADADQQKVGADYQTGLTKALQDYMDRRDGKEGTAATPGIAEQFGPPNPKAGQAAPGGGPGGFQTSPVNMGGLAGALQNQLLPAQMGQTGAPQTGGGPAQAGDLSQAPGSYNEPLPMRTPAVEGQSQIAAPAAPPRQYPPENLGAQAGFPAIPGIKQDPRAAALAAVGSQYGALQKLGMADIAAQGKQQLTPENILAMRDVSPENRAMAITAMKLGDAGYMRFLKSDTKYATVGNQRVPDNIPFDAREQWGPVEDLGNGQFGQRDKATGQIRFAPKGMNVTQTVDGKAELEEHKIGVQRADKLVQEGETAATTAVKRLQDNQEAAHALANGAVAGLGSTPQVIIDKLAQGLGFTPKDGAATEYLANKLKERILTNVPGGTVGGRFTDSDLKFTESISGSQLNQPAVLKRLLALDTATQMKIVATHEQRVEGLSPQFPAAAPAWQAMVPKFRFSSIDDPTFDKMLQNALTGKPTTQGLSAAEIAAPMQQEGPAAAPTTTQGWSIQKH